jgi:hypothetical protein
MVEFYPEGTLPLDDPKEIGRLARLFYLERIKGQTFEVLYRSEAIGGPLVFLHELHVFPSLKDIQNIPRTHGTTRNLVIAAQKPTWRIAWKVSL